MAKSREELSVLLRSILGSSNVYYQPPNGYKLKYPCIIYSLNTIDTVKADNKLYLGHNKYDIQVIDKSPTSPYPMKILEEVQMASMSSKPFVTDNLNHFNLVIYW